MKTRSTTRPPQIAERRAGRLAARAIGREALWRWWLGSLLLAIAAPALTPQTAAAQALHGERIVPLVSPETPQAGLTNPAAVAPAHIPGATLAVRLPPASELANAPRSEVTIGGNPYLTVTFRQVSNFPFSVTPEMTRPDANPAAATARVLEQIPPAVRGLEGKEVALNGFMLPVKMNEGLVTDFVLLPNTMGCCYGRMPRINEMIIVNTAGKGFKPVQNVLLTIAGTFHVGAIRKNNYLIGIYEMDGKGMIEAAALSSK